MADNEHSRLSWFAEKARSALSNAGHDDRVRQAAAVTRDVAARAEEASKTVTRRVEQGDAWDELRADVQVLTEIARAHHALPSLRGDRGEPRMSSSGHALSTLG